MAVIALIPARGGSKGIPGKNIKLFNGKPLISYTIEVAKQAASIDRVVVSTDDAEIAKIAIAHGAEVPFIRPSEISGDEATDYEVIRHAVDWFKDNSFNCEVVAFLRPTNIFRTCADIDEAILKLTSTNLDSVRGISKVAYSPYWMKQVVGDKLCPFLRSDYEYARRQELPPTYQANGTIDAIRIDTIISNNSVYGENIGFIHMDEIARTDIDSPLDFTIAEYLHAKYMT